MTRKLPAVILLLCFLSDGCARNRELAPSKIEMPLVRSFSAEEVDIGYQIHSHILSSFHVYTEPGAVGYIHEIGNALTGSKDPQASDYRFTILYNDRIYATAAPGGFIYLTTGMINFLENEAELAAVLAHEIGTLQYKNPRLSNSKKMVDSLTQTVVAVGPAFGQIGALAALGVVLVHAAAVGEEKTREEIMMEADALAMKYMVAAGYDPQGLIDVLYRFLHADKRVLPYFYDYYQSHPISQERFMKISESFQKLPLHGKTLPVNRDRFQAMTKGIREMYRA